MFTGLVEGRGTVRATEDDGPGKRLVIKASEIAERAEIGASVAVNGCCLTVVAVDSAEMTFEAGAETLQRTNLGSLLAGHFVNVESSLRMGDEIGGHLVTGHIDGSGELMRRIDQAEWSDMWFRAPPELTRQMASKGSVAVDGVSLTLVEVEDEQFSVALIPHTLKVTTLGELSVGDRVNIETDILAKYVQRQMEGPELK
ncbi:riboflavin synthase [Pirellulales bacterium]|nr:riboflavin synthase [Pirellulales bacterium]